MAWDAGIRAFDTAPHYGVGVSERRVGAFLAGRPRDEFTVCTKVGRRLVPATGDVQGEEGFYDIPPLTRVRDYSRDGVRRSLEESLGRLGLDRVDIVLIHDPDDFMGRRRTKRTPRGDGRRRGHPHAAGNSRRRLLPPGADTRRAVGRAEPGASALTGAGPLRRRPRCRVVIPFWPLSVSMDGAIGCGQYRPEHGRPMLLQDAQVRADYLRPGKAGRDDKHHRVGGTHDHAGRRAALQGRTIHDDEITETAELLKMLQIELGFTPGRQPGPRRDHLQAGNRRYGDQQ